MKTCTKCGKKHPLSEYYVYKSTGKLYTWCKSCHYEMTKPARAEWVKDNKERAKELQRVASLEWRRRMPGGVYFIQTDKGSYIGQSDHVDFRLMQHQYTNVDGKGAKVLDFYVIEQIDDRDKRLEREKYWIQKLKPDLNIQFTERRYKKRQQVA